MTKPFVAVVVAAAVAAGYAVAVWNRAPASRDGGRERPRSARGDDAPLRRPAGERPLVERAVATSAVATAAPVVGATQGAARPSTEEIDPPSDGERHAYAESVFDAQPFDRSWAPQAAERLTTVAGSVAVPGVRAGRAECRTNLCKLEVSADGASPGNSYLRTFMRASKWDGSIMVVRGEPDARGTHVMTLYFATSATVLPEPPVAEP